MALSVGSFFKNAIKGAAQQYNQNVAYKKELVAKEEAAVSADKRELSNLQSLATHKFNLEKQLNAGKKVEDKTKYANIIGANSPLFEKPFFLEKMKNFKTADGSQSVFRNGNLYIPRTRAYENLGDSAKREANFDAMKSILTPKLLESFSAHKPTYNDILGRLRDSWKDNLRVIESKEGDGQKIYTFKKDQWEYLNSIPGLGKLIAQDIGTSVKELSEFVKAEGDYSDGTGMMFEYDEDTYGIKVNDYFKNKDKAYDPASIETMKKMAIRMHGFDKNKPIKISAIANDIHDFARDQGIVQLNDGAGGFQYKIKAGEIINAVTIVSELFQNVNSPSDVTNMDLIARAKRVMQEKGMNKMLYDDPDVLLKVLSNSLPASFRYEGKLTFNETGKVDLKELGILKQLVGGNNPLAGVRVRAQAAADLESDAKNVIMLIKDGDADIGALAEIPRAIENIALTAKELAKQAVGVFKGNREGGKIADTFSRMFAGNVKEMDAAKAMPTSTAEERKQSQMAQKNAILKFYITTMTFRMAANIQNTGATEAGPRISDNDVSIIAAGLAATFIANKQSFAAVAEAIALDANRRKTINNAYATGDAKQIAAARMMETMGQGDVSMVVRNLTRDIDTVNGGDGLRIRGTQKPEPIKFVLPGGGDSQNKNNNNNNNKKEVKRF